MRRRQFVFGGLCTAAALGAHAIPPAQQNARFKAVIKGCLCPGCGRKLQTKLAALPGVTGATVDVKSGDVQVTTRDTRTGKAQIKATIGRTNFKVVSLEGPLPLEDKP